MARSNKFVVHTTYCNGVDFTHEHPTIIEAAKEYTRMIADAIEPPTSERPALSGGQRGESPKHVRQVTMLVYDIDENLIHHIDSGIFGCEDRAGEPELV